MLDIQEFRGEGHKGDLDKGEVVPDCTIKIGSTYYSSYHGYRTWERVSTWRSAIAHSDNLTSANRDDAGRSTSRTVMFSWDADDHIAHYCSGASSAIYAAYLQEDSCLLRAARDRSV